MLLGALASMMPVGAAAEPAAELRALRDQDIRVATIGYRLATASRDLCPDQAWLAGLVVHDLAQYGGAHRPAAVRLFALGDGPAVLALAEGGAAQAAGLRLDDRLIAVDGARFPPVAPSPDPSFDSVERSIESLEAALADGVAEFDVRRQDRALAIRVEAIRGCATRFQLIPSGRLNARADGRYVQLTSGLVSYVRDDDELAAVVAHEFAHNILDHRRRLDAQEVRRGFLRNFGRNARMIRATEIEADRLSVHLVDRAGYDVDAPARFWRRFGPRGLALFDAPTHPRWRDRVAALEAESARIRAARAAGQPVNPLMPAPAPVALRQSSN